MYLRKTYRPGYWPLVITLVLSLCGGIVRMMELNAAFDQKGLPISGHPLTLLLVGITLAVIIIAILFSRPVPKEPKEGYGHFFPAGKPLFLLSSCLLGILLLTASVVWAISQTGAGIFEMLTWILAFLSGLSVIVLAVKNYKGENKGATGFLLLIPVFYSCIRLVFCFRSWSADPVILDYIYKMLSLICSSLGLYYAAGFYFGPARPRRSLTFCLLSVFFSLVTLWDNHSTADFLSYVFYAGYMLIIAAQILRGCVRCTKKTEKGLE